MVNMRKIVVPMVLIIIILLTLYLLSYFTTYKHWDGLWPKGKWTIRVVGEDGRILKDAKLEPSGGPEPIFYPFHTPKCIKANDSGEIILFIRSSFGYDGGSTYRMFRIWPVDSRQCRPVVRFRISAPGYHPAFIDTNAILSCENSLLVVRLEKINKDD